MDHNYLHTLSTMTNSKLMRLNQFNMEPQLKSNKRNKHCTETIYLYFRIGDQIL